MADNGSDGAIDAVISTYDSSDLSFFKELVDDLLDELTSAGDYLYESSPRGELKLQLAAAVFGCARSGERDYPSLRRRVLDQFHTPAAWRGTSRRA